MNAAKPGVMMRARGMPLLAGCVVVASAGCRDLSSFTTAGAHYEGQVVLGDFVRAGVDPSAKSCLTLDADHLEDVPGTLSTSDGRFHAAALRPIPQIWHDPLSTLSFGEGRLRNLVYLTTATTPFADGRGDDVLIILSLMQGGDVEVRLIRGAPGLSTDAGSVPSSADNLFAVFDLVRSPGPCSY